MTLIPIIAYSYIDMLQQVSSPGVEVGHSFAGYDDRVGQDVPVLNKLLKRRVLFDDDNHFRSLCRDVENSVDVLRNQIATNG